jgi:TPR repeat protein
MRGQYEDSISNGIGVDVDDQSLSADCFKLSADQGDSHGQVNYGYCLLKGLGVSVDERLAAH